MGSTAVIDAYAVGGFSPALVFDFDSEYYRTGGTESTFDSSITHARSGNATMVDSDGLLKWAPHNLQTGASNPSSEFASTHTDNAGVDPSGANEAVSVTSTADGLSNHAYTPLPFNGSITHVGYVKKSQSNDYVFIFGSGANSFSFTLNLTNGNVVNEAFGSGATGSVEVTDAGNGWYKFVVIRNEDVFNATVGITFRPSRADSDNGASALTGDGYLLWGVHSYRSDLGGMVDNPDTGNSYVPTTTAARYLPRRGHHVYNGTEWVNEGLLVESEARTNLVMYSQDFAQWTKTAPMTVTANQVGPDGVSNSAYTITFPSGTDWIWKSFSGSSSTTYTVSMWLSGSGTIKLGAYTTVLGFGSVDIITLTDTLTRYDYTFSTGVGDTDFRLNLGRIGGSTTATSVVCYGAQIEAGSTPSSYIPNLAASGTVTRAADTLTVPSANLPWPSPVVIGEELVDWGTGTVDPNFTVIDATTLSFDGTQSQNDLASISSALTAGKVYQWTVVISNYVQGQIAPYWNGTSAGVKLGANGTTTAVYVATGTSITVQDREPTAFIGDVNISVREINPLAVSIQMDGRMTYADTGILGNPGFLEWRSGLIGIDIRNRTDSVRTGRVLFRQYTGGVTYSVENPADVYSPGINVPYNIASRHGSTFINGAVDGTALTANTTPTALPDLSSTNLNLAFDYMGTIRTFRVWADDLGDENIEIASATAPVIIGLPTIGVS
jgi:hypothetical protein